MISRFCAISTFTTYVKPTSCSQKDFYSVVGGGGGASYAFVCVCPVRCPCFQVNAPQHLAPKLEEAFCFVENFLRRDTETVDYLLAGLNRKTLSLWDCSNAISTNRGRPIFQHERVQKILQMLNCCN